MDKKVRIIVGPNGSGKSTIKQVLSVKHENDFGFFINADDIERTLNQGNSIYNHLHLSNDEVITFLKKHSINKIHSLTEISKNIIVSKKSISVSKRKINSYEAAALADLFRTKALELKIKFSYETVFSDKSKINFIKKL